MKECKGILGWMFGHNYQTRFDVKKSKADFPNMNFKSDSIEVLEAFRDCSKTYVCDVCTRCGDVIKRDEK